MSTDNNTVPKHTGRIAVYPKRERKRRRERKIRRMRTESRLTPKIGTDSSTETR